MAEPIAFGLLALVIVALAATYFVFKLIKPLVVNAVVGLIVLFAAGFVGLGVQITPVVVLIVAFGGVPAGLLVILLAQAGLVFTQAVVAPAAVALVGSVLPVAAFLP